MKTIAKQTNNVTKIDKFNMKMSKSLKDIVGGTITVTKACIGRDFDQSGEEVDAGALITETDVYTTVSTTAIDLIDSLIEIIDEDGEVNVKVESRKSNSDRDYLVLSIVG